MEENLSVIFGDGHAKVLTTKLTKGHKGEEKAFLCGEINILLHPKYMK
jgi:hypothetical protein